MHWQEGIAVLVVLAGLGAGAFLVAQRPSFWIEFGARLIRALMPRVISYLSKPMSLEDQKAWHECIRRGGEWDSFRKRCKR